MKRKVQIYSVISLILFTNIIYGQELMTIGEVFDFEINDEFQLSSSLPGQPPNADRITIIDKYFSENGDTIFYVQSHDSYWTSLSYEPPYLTYHFWTDTVTIKYYDLDSSIYYYEIGFQYDTNIFYNENYCDSLINWCQYYSGGGFEPDFYRKSYGRGLGLVGSYFEYGGNYDPSVDSNLFYYKKNGLECGTPDLTTVDIKNNLAQINEFELYPNPTELVVFIKDKMAHDVYELLLFTCYGRQIMRNEFIGGINELNLQDLEKGVYVIKIVRNEKIHTFKLIKK